MQAEKQRTQQNTNTAAAKPGAAIKLTQAGKAASPQPQKSKKKISAGAVLAIFLLVVIIAAGVLVYLNVGGLRQKLVTFCGRPGGEGDRGDHRSRTGAKAEGAGRQS